MTLTNDQFTAIRDRAVNAATRELADGCVVTWEEYDELGEQAISWLCDRLNLTCSARDERGITLEVRS